MRGFVVAKRHGAAYIAARLHLANGVLRASLKVPEACGQSGIRGLTDDGA